MRVFRTKPEWRVAFGFFVLMSCAFPVGMRLSFPAMFEGDLVWRLLFFNGLTLVVTLFFGVIGFMQIRIDHDKLVWRFPFYTRVILERDLIGWDRRSKTSRFLLLFVGKKKKFAMDVSLFEDQEALVLGLEELLKGTPKGARGGLRVFSPVWEGLFLLVGAYLAVTGAMAFGWVAVAIAGVPFILWVTFASHYYQFEAYVQKEWLWVGSKSFELAKLRGLHHAAEGSYVNGTIARFGYDDAVISSNLVNYEEICDRLHEVLIENRKDTEFQPVPSHVWDGYYPHQIS